MTDNQEPANNVDTFQVSHIPNEIWSLVFDGSTTSEEMHLVLAMTSMVCKEFNQIVRDYKSHSTFVPYKFGLRGAVISYGHLGLLSMWTSLKVLITSKDVELAIRSGYLDCLQHVWSKWNFFHECSAVEGLLLEHSLARLSILRNRKEIYEFIVEQVGFSANYLYYAISLGHIECTTWMFEKAFKTSTKIELNRVMLACGTNREIKQVFEELHKEHLKRLHTFGDRSMEQVQKLRSMMSEHAFNQEMQSLSQK